MQTVAIVGTGLIGGSFALALKANGFDGTILGVSSERSIGEALRVSAIDSGVTLDEAVARADLIYLSQPISGILETLPRLAGRTKSECLITDAGSTKRAIVARAQDALQNALFLGGHPMAGKEARGAANASAELFRGRPYLLTPLTDEQRVLPQVHELAIWIERIGGRVHWMSPEQHDALVAASSHAPQMLSTALSAVLARRTDTDGVTSAAGPGLFDMTRLALSSYDIWRDILHTNADEIALILEAVERELAQMRTELRSDIVQSHFRDGAAFSSLLRKS